DGGVEGKHEREIRRRSVHGSNADRRRALGAEAKPWSRAQGHVEAAGGEGLLELGVAAKAGDLDFEPLLFKNLGLDPHFGRAEGKRVGDRLAKPSLTEPDGRAGRPQGKRREEAYQRAPPQRVEHRLSLLLGFIGEGGRPA